MKKLLSVTGTIATGKTTLCSLLHEKLNIPYYAIDEYRVKFCAENIAGEFIAWDNLIKDISVQKCAILETSGLSKNLPSIYQHFDKVFVILLYCPIKVAKDRLLKRKNNTVIPFFGKSKPVDVLEDMQNRLLISQYDYLYDTSKIVTNKIACDVERYFF